MAKARKTKQTKEKLFKSWMDVPGNSTLVISVTGTTASKMVLAHLDGIVALPNGSAVGRVDGILDTVNGTANETPLVSPNIYTIDIINSFITDAESTVHAHVEDPDGAPFETPFDTVIKRKKGQTEIVTLVVGTKQGKQS